MKTPQASPLFPRPSSSSVLVGALVFVLLLLIWHPLFLGNYLLFHALVELFSIVVGCGIFILAWNTRRMLSNDYLLLLGIGYLFVAGLDLMHMLTFKGMGVVKDLAVDPATQLWVSARALEAGTLLGAFVFLRHRLAVGPAFLVYSALCALMLLAIFRWEIFPDAFVEGSGLTSFKQAAEYGIIAALVLGIVLLHRHRADFDAPVLHTLAGALLLTIAGEICFTLYSRPDGFFNAAGHYFKLASFWCIYKALIETGLRRPYELLYRDLKLGEKALRRERDELERRVEERTADLRDAVSNLERRAIMLRSLAGQLTQAEETERRRVAGILHDHLQQQLVAARMKLNAGRLRLATVSAAETVADVDRLIGEAIDAARTLSVELSPPVLYESGLSGALPWLAETHCRKQGLEVRVEVDRQAEPQDENVRIILFGAVRELLLNVLKHSGTASATVVMSLKGDEVRIIVRDEGAGFDAAATRENFGMFSIRERLGFLGGRMRVESAPGQGVCVELSAPLRSGPGSGAGGEEDEVF